jgi:HrpA-like RNA helicase
MNMNMSNNNTTVNSNKHHDSNIPIPIPMPIMGDMLVFLTGSEEIEMTKKQLISQSKHLPSYAPKYTVLGLYSQLSSDEQMRVFDRDSCADIYTRRIICATNIAETSITIPNIRYVIDCGKVKVRQYNSEKHIDTLKIQACTQSESWQRSGRAGRIAAGQCYRMYPEEAFTTHLKPAIQPEILRTNLAHIVLQLISLSIDPLTFDYITPPSHSTIKDAYKQLLMMNAVDQQRHITTLGRQMMLLPLPPMYSRMLLESCTEEYMCSDEMLTIVSLLSVESIWYPVSQHDTRLNDALKKREKFAHPHSDHLTYLHIYNTYKKQLSSNQQRQWCLENYIQYRSLQRVDQIRQQLKDILLSMKLPIVSVHHTHTHTHTHVHNDSGSSSSMDHESIVRKCITTGLFQHAARRIEIDTDSMNSNRSPSNEYETILGHNRCRIHPSSVVSMTQHQQQQQHSNRKLHGNSNVISKNSIGNALVYTEFVYTENAYIRDVTFIDAAWLHTIAPKLYDSTAST